MEKHNWDEIFVEARKVARDCQNLTDLAKKLNIARTSLCSELSKRGWTFLDLWSQEDLAKAGEQKQELIASGLKKELDYYKALVGRQQWMSDAIKEAAAMIRPEPVSPPVLGKSRKLPQTALLQVSDVHYGQKTPADDVGILGEYNPEIAERRFNQTFNIGAKIALQQGEINPTEEFVVLAEGDWVEHAHLRPGHEMLVSMGVVKQALKMAELGIQNLRMLAGIFPKVRFVGVSGNHGRVDGDPRKCNATENFDYMIYKIMKMALTDQPNVEFVIPETWYANFRVYDYRLFALHGEDIKSYYGFPWYGATTAVRRYVSMFRAAQKKAQRSKHPRTIQEYEDLDQVPDYAYLAHFHTSVEWGAPDVEHFANGSLAEVSLYSKQIMTINRPSQRLQFIHREHGVTSRWPIYLD